jgi:prolyl-tRNA synthetase
LSPTCEESVTYLAKTVINSYKDLPKAIYQVSNKYRDELRPQAGLIRTKEFSMKDGYSFHASKEDLIEFYTKVKELYIELFDSLNISYEIEEADNGDIGGSQSLEFLINGIEVAHIFQLDTKYSDSFNLTYMDKDNTTKPVYMGCYGIGVSRLAQLLLAYDNKGLLFPEEFKPYDYVVISKDETTLESTLGAATWIGKSLLIDDRNCSLGAKIKDAELMGLDKIILNKGEAKYECR